MSRSTWLESRRVYGVLLVLSLASAALSAADKTDDATNEDLKPKSKDAKGSYKNTTGAGHYYSNQNQNGKYGNNNGGYGNEGYGGNYGNGGGYSGGGYGGGGGYGSGSGGYGNGGYGGGGYDHSPVYDYNHHLVDDYVCDVDASILVVTNSENAHDKDYKKGGDKDNYGKKEQGAYGGSSGGYGSSSGGYGGGNGGAYGNGGSYGSGYGGQHNNYGPQGGYVKHAIAHRLRCSVVAIHNDSACTTCCQIAARRDKSIAKERIIGFIIDNNQVHLANAYRKKRDTAQPPAPPPSAAPSSGSSYGGDQKYGKDGGNYGSGYTRPELPVFPPLNARCVCCAPKHHYDNHYVGDYSKNDYGNGGSYGNENYGHGGNNYGQHPGGYAVPQPVPYGGESNYGNQYQQPANYGGNDNAYGPPPPPPAYGNNGGYAAPSNPPTGGYGHEQPNYHAPPPPPAQYSAPYKQ